MKYKGTASNEDCYSERKNDLNDSYETQKRCSQFLCNCSYLLRAETPRVGRLNEFDLECLTAQFCFNFAAQQMDNLLTQLEDFFIRQRPVGGNIS